MRLLSPFFALILPIACYAEIATSDLPAAAETIAEAQSEAEILVIGEFHGTQEIPVLFGALADRMSTAGPLLVGLEIPAQEQPAIDQFLASEGSKADRGALLQGEFWQRAHERSDGRRSLGTVALLDALRQIQRRGQPLAVVAYDDELFHDGRDRDAAMATALKAVHLERPQRKLLVLTGNYHARRTQPTEATFQGKPYQPPVPMVARLQESLADTKLTTINLGAHGGSFWGCREACGVVELPPRLDPELSAPFVFSRIEGAYDFELRLAQISPSPPTPAP